MNALMPQIVALIERALDKPAQSLDAQAAMDQTPGWDSLKTMEIVVAVERHFQTTFSAQQMMSMDSAASICDALIANGVGQG
ncbi:MAG: acyl carrier protein [Rhodoferax sp.]|jgi:acyl carrier protein|nr:acyl carrier protein [Rhodoferax sp.]MBP9060499.1 acyl carrier protein [Rhodoferax sp.]MBP9683221.1 acyl carrier protein [Rhodoferax sp.]